LTTETLFDIRVQIPFWSWRERAVDGPSRSIAPALKREVLFEGWYSVAFVIPMDRVSACFLGISTSKWKEKFGHSAGLPE
jgi:hypothetical protein